MPFERQPQASIRVSAPGRVNLLGEHVDYNDGAVLPVAIDRYVRLSAMPNDDGVLYLRALDFDQQVSVDLDRLADRIDRNGSPLPDWALYPAGVAWALQGRGLRVTGVTAACTSDVPIGAGLSSSAAVEVAFAALWRQTGGWQIDSMKLAQVCQEAENRYVGVQSGLMDQFASVHGAADHALYFDTRHLTHRALPLPQGIAIVIADSGVRRTLAGSAYNERRAACEEAVQRLRQHLPQIQALRDVSPEEFARHARHLPEIVRRRARHVVEECARVESAVVCLQRGDITEFGRLMFEGHASLRDLYQVSCPELDSLVKLAAGLPGCLGARLTGAGFGGCTVNLVETKQASMFIEKLISGYRHLTGRNAQVYLCRASNGVKVELCPKEDSDGE